MQSEKFQAFLIWMLSKISSNPNWDAVQNFQRFKSNTNHTAI